MQTVPNNETPLSDQGIIDIKYQKNLNMPLILIGLPMFLGFSGFFFLRANYIQAIFFACLSLTAATSLYLSFKIRDLKKLTLLKLIGAVVTFVLLGGSILTGLLTPDLHMAYPWIFFCPMTTVLFFSSRTGIVVAAIFCLAAALTLAVLEFPAWAPASQLTFKLNSILCLVIILLIAMVSENSRVRMRNHLLEARNGHRQAEALQRRTNSELKHEIQMRLESEQALAQSERRYRALFEESAASLWEEDWSAVKTRLDELSPVAGPDLERYLKERPEEAEQLIVSIQVLAANRTTLQLYEAGSMAALLRNIGTVMPLDVSTFMIQRICALYLRGRYDGQVAVQNLGGRRLHLLVGSAIPAGYERSWEKVFTSVYDITDRVVVEEEKKRVDRHLLHTRQIQAIASLAGGIAHQFNNSLAVICGNLDLLELDPQGPGRDNQFVGSLRSSTERMRSLTEQLLAYAQGGKYQPQDIAINDLIRELLKTGKAARKPGIHIHPRFEEGVRLRGGDLTQIRNVLEAVLTNAVEAMPDGGQVLIGTQSRNVAAGDPGPDAGLAPGRYAVITVEDHGIGMDEETCRRIFEPFFSTKFVGRGLGMAAADGIVRNHDGRIQVQSTIGQGTRVTIHLPAAAPDPGAGQKS
jgi:signal transduction histidine kinase